MTQVSLDPLAAWGDQRPTLPDDLVGQKFEIGASVVSTDSERAYVVMMVRFLPVGLLGLVAASLLAAFMSTIDTHVNLAASFYVNDLHRRFIAPGRSDRHYVWAARCASVAVLALGALLAYESESISGLFTFFLAFLGGVGPIYLLRWLWWRVTAVAEITAMVASSLSTVFLSFTKLQGWVLGAPIAWRLGPLSPEGVLTGEGRLLIVVVFAGTCALLSLLVRRAPDPARLVPFYEQIRPIGAWGPVRALASTGPRRGEGSTTVIGVVSGLALTYSLLFGIGFVILDRTNALVVAVLIALVSSVGVVHACRRLASGTSEQTL